MIDPGEFSSVSLATASSPRFGGYLHRRRRAGADFLASLCQHPLLFAIALQIVLIVRSARRRRLLALDIFVVVAMLLGPFQPQLAEIRTPPRAVAAGRAAPVPYSLSPMGNSSATTRHVGGLTAQGKQVDDSHQRPNRENRSVSF
jgi:hypothetical protein